MVVPLIPPNIKIRVLGGRGEIRTREGIAPQPVFETGALNQTQPPFHLNVVQYS